MSEMERVTQETERLRRVGTPCAYCGVAMTRWGRDTQITEDHIVPAVVCRDSNGKRRPRANNRAWVCHRCNNDKGNKMIDDWLAELIAAKDRRAAIVDAFLAQREGRAPKPFKWQPPRWA